MHKLVRGAGQLPIAFAERLVEGADIVAERRNRVVRKHLIALAVRRLYIFVKAFIELFADSFLFAREFRRVYVGQIFEAVRVLRLIHIE